MQVKEKIITLLVELFEIDPEEAKDDVELYGGLGFDSTETVELVLELEKVFNIKIPEKEITKFSCLRDIEAVILGKVARCA
jgi:acyl carrier protein